MRLLSYFMVARCWHDSHEVALLLADVGRRTALQGLLHKRIQEGQAHINLQVLA